MEHENKYDLFSVSDVAISAKSSMVIEAHKFTDNIIVYPNNNSASTDDFESLNEQYPFAEIISLDNIYLLIDKLEYYRNNPSKKDPNCNISDYLIDLSRLFADIEGVIENKSKDKSDISSEPEELNRIGETLFSNGDIEGARQTFEKAIQIKPDHAEAINNLGVVYWEMNMFPQGLMQFKKAHNVNPFDRNIARNYSDALMHQGFPERADEVIHNLNASIVKDE